MNRAFERKTTGRPATATQFGSLAPPSYQAAKPEGCYLRVESPLGDLFIATTPAGVAYLSYPAGEAAFVAEVEDLLGGRLEPGAGDDQPGEAARLAHQARSQLREYFAGTRRRFDLPLDLSRQTPFQQRVLGAVAAIPWGTVASYGEIADRVGAAGAARAVGGVMARNTLPILVPCHRVVRSGGQLGGFGGSANSLRHKAFLLGLEGIAVEGDLTREARLRVAGG